MFFDKIDKIKSWSKKLIKISLNKLNKKRVFACLVLLLVILGITLPIIAEAAVPLIIKIGIVIGGAAGIGIGGELLIGELDGAKLLAGVFIGIPVMTFFFIASLVHGVLINMLLPLSEAFLEVAAIAPAGVIDGWRIVRDLVNATFIIILTWIGIAVILKLKEYEMGKILPIAILMIILVQFTPPIINMIVHTSNDISIVFLNLTDDLVGRFKALRYDAIAAAGALGGQIFNPTVSFEEYVRYISIVLIFGVLLLFSALIFLVFAVLFFFRVIMIWLLFVTAPVAFASYLIPQIKSFWTQWWNQLIQWSILPIFLTFGMWMSVYIVGPEGAFGEIRLEGVPVQEIGAGVHDQLAEWIVPLFGLGFLIGALIMAMKSSAFGASAIMGTGTAIAAFATGTITGAAIKAPGRMLKGIIGGAREALKSGPKAEKGISFKERLGIGAQRFKIGARGGIKGARMTIGEGIKGMGRGIMEEFRDDARLVRNVFIAKIGKGYVPRRFTDESEKEEKKSEKEEKKSEKEETEPLVKPVSKYYKIKPEDYKK